MPFTTNLTGVSDVDASVILAYDASYIVAVGQNNVMDQFVQYKQDIGAVSITLPKFARLAVATTPLTESDDVTSAALVDSAVTLTPLEYGNVVTTTKLANLQTGGKADLAAATVVGINHGQTMDKLAINALDASGNAYIFGGAANADNLTAGNVASLTFLNTFYNKLARASVPTINGTYVMVAHDDVIADLRAATTAGSWQDVVKYTSPGEALVNEVGMYGGFRIVRDNQCPFVDQTGAGTVDVYTSYFFGFNGLGKAVSNPGGLVATGPFDKLNRFVNLGWYEVCAYKIIDTDAVWKGVCASSVGQNS